MRQRFLPSFREAAYFVAGYVVGSSVFCGIYMWNYSGTVPGIVVALGLPVTVFYFLLLLLLRFRQPALVGAAALLFCGVAIGLFPLVGLWPVYMWRLPFAIIGFAIHILILMVIMFAVYFVTRWTKAVHTV
jgi:hypothetical protein